MHHFVALVKGVCMDYTVFIQERKGGLVIKPNKNKSISGKTENPQGPGKGDVCPVCGGYFAASCIRGLSTCQTCGFVMASVRPQPEQAAVLYGEDYFHGDGYADYAAERPALNFNFKEHLKRILREMGNATGQKTLFEAGCGFGYFLELSRGFFKEVSGCELSPFAAGRARKAFGLNVQEGDVLTLPLSGPYDVMCMWDVLPSLAEPDKVLARVAEALAPGGILALTMPNIGSRFARISGRFWPLIHFPWRVGYYSPETITKLLEKSGFRVVYVRPFHKTRSLREILYQLVALKFRRPDWFHALERLPFMKVLVPMGFADEMFIMAHKA